MKPQNIAAVMRGKGQLQIEEWPMPPIGEYDVGIQVKYVGLCGSDMHMFEFGSSGTYIVKPPFILGHEISGVVYAVGNKVKKYKVGDRVTAEPGIPCGNCEFCMKGNYNMCPDIHFKSAPPYDGMMQKYIVHPEKYVFKLPDTVDMKKGSLTEPAAVGIHANELGDVGLNNTVTILGAGCIGLITMMIAKARGARRIFVVDTLKNRLEMAKQLGADETINAIETDPVQCILEKTNSEGTDVVFETAGNKITAYQTSQLVRRTGKIVLVGNIHGDVAYNFRNLAVKEASLIAMWRYHNNFPEAIEALSHNWVDDKIITAVYPFEEAQNAFEQSINHKDAVVKTMLKIT